MRQRACRVDGGDQSGRSLELGIYVVAWQLRGCAAVPRVRVAVMADDPNTIVLKLLRRLDVKMDRIFVEIQDVKRRITSLEGQVALLHGDFAGQSIRIDRIEERLDRIETRLGLIDA